MTTSNRKKKTALAREGRKLLLEVLEISEIGHQLGPSQQFRLYLDHSGFRIDRETKAKLTALCEEFIRLDEAEQQANAPRAEDGKTPDGNQSRSRRHRRGESGSDGQRRKSKYRN